MFGISFRPKGLGDAELSYNVLGKATFGALIYSLIFLQIATQPLWFDPSTPIPPMSPALAAVTLVLNIGLLLLPLFILVLFCLGYYGLVYRAMAGLPTEVRESIQKARILFRTFWLIVGLAVLFFFGSIGAALLGAPEPVRLAMYLPVVLAPSGLLISLLLFLGYAVWAALPTPGMLLLQRLVWAAVVLVGASAAGTAVLTAIAWREIEASGVITAAYSPWTTIPSGAFTVVTCIALYVAFRWVRRHLPLRTGSPDLTTPSALVAGDPR